MINTLQNKPEEVTAVEASLREQWDPTNHIENLFQSVKVGTETLFQMDFITRAECNKVFVKYVYTAIKESGRKWTIRHSLHQMASTAKK
jgi:UDP-N-acetylmuramate-alanine ligase